MRYFLGLASQNLIIVALAMGSSGAALAETDCDLKLLQGTYVFTATGHNISVMTGAAQPKAILELITFNGDGTLSVPAATVSINGTILRSQGTGTYAVQPNCLGTITFSSGLSFDTFVSPKGDVVWMIQTNPNTVFQGTATKTK